MPAGFAAAEAKAQRAAADHRVADTTKWWRALHDRELNSLIDRAIAASPTLEVALDRLQQARAQEFVIVGSALPMLGASEGGGIGSGSDLGRGRASQTLVSAENGAGIEPDHQSRRLRRRLGNRRIRKISPCDRGGAIRRRSSHCGAQRGSDFPRRRRNPRLSRFARLANAACGLAQEYRRRAEVRRFRAGAFQSRHHQRVGRDAGAARTGAVAGAGRAADLANQRRRAT